MGSTCSLERGEQGEQVPGENGEQVQCGAREQGRKHSLELEKQGSM
jgi:hypothetical protein